jgi:polyhydroxybutyrate depolymerase
MKLKVFVFYCIFIHFVHTQTNGSLNHGGLNRTFVYYVPTSWNQSQQLPLLIVLHGLTQTGPGVMNITNFNDIAEQNNFIVCYPNGVNNAWNANMNITVSTVDDIGFVETLATYFQSDFNTDPAKQYLCGFSNGGFMSHKIACESSQCFAAIATVAGNMSDTTYANCNPQFNPAVLHIHGTADAVVPYNGGSGTGVSVDQTIQKWASFLNCNSNPTTVNLSNTSLTDLSSPERITYVNCTNSLELIKITGGGHQWPGINTLFGGAGTINMDFYSPQVIWDFLAGKSCPLSSLEIQEWSSLTIYPNPSSQLLQINSEVQFDYEIYNLLGQKIQYGQMSKEISIEKLDKGPYQINLLLNKEIKIFKFLKDQ